ncbi:squalene--hopene cyclase [Leptolyngbya sp. FACHB-321]|uniref:squalene--hopene cyclase n=1 Tax=Leptolyngbya sp. FACHB-321 TaxID=2692807 RepID=UPI00168242B5|nr:squalene--hopene cyclase [Leptolyngbya sp. FACHB-321]MBD2034185.1 squalene--hopene cyclase [Leptolyngbya sp. FACHB-321]
MQTQEQGVGNSATAGLIGVNEAIARSQNYLLSLQYPEGYWWAELESNVTITAEVVLLHKLWGTDKTRPLHKVEAYLRSQQREHGGWELFYGDGGELSTSVEAYMALRLLGVPATDPALQKARSFILRRGGISKTRIFTKFHLGLIGCYDWRGLPSIPSWVMLLPDAFPVNIYELSSWARGSTVPLLIVFDRKPVYITEPAISLDELYTEGRTNVRFELPRQGDWTDLFVHLDSAFKLAEDLNLVPFRQEGIDAAEKWVLERQEATGDWGGIIPAMLNSLLALRALNYDVADPIVERGLKAVDNFALETDEHYWIQPCISPVWDTALVMRSLVDSGLAPDHPALVRGGKWLLEKQILDYGDWAVKNRKGKPGAWAFEFDNRFYPDVDDSAVVVMALCAVQLPNEALKQAAIDRAVDWIATMQCTPGGWAAFDLNNDQDWLNAIPYGDLKAMIDPNTADVTARVLEMVGKLETRQKAEGRGQKAVSTQNALPTPYSLLPTPAVDRALAYLRAEQEPEGCWFGRWGVNYIYGTSGVLAALSLVAAETHQREIERGASWLVSCQNADGGWGETCFSYNDPSLKGQGDSTASQTAWALIGLMAAGDATGTYAMDTLDRGIQYLLQTQQPDGTWNEDYFTGTGFPCHFYLKYHLYQQHFPLTAIGRYRLIK